MGKEEEKKRNEYLKYILFKCILHISQFYFATVIYSTIFLCVCAQKNGNRMLHIWLKRWLIAKKRINSYAPNTMQTLHPPKPLMTKNIMEGEKKWFYYRKYPWVCVVAFDLCIIGKEKKNEHLMFSNGIYVYKHSTL